MAKPLTLPPLTETEVTALRQLYDTATAPRYGSALTSCASPTRALRRRDTHTPAGSKLVRQMLAEWRVYDWAKAHGLEL